MSAQQFVIFQLTIPYKDALCQSKCFMRGMIHILIARQVVKVIGVCN